MTDGSRHAMRNIFLTIFVIMAISSAGLSRRLHPGDSKESREKKPILVKDLVVGQAGGNENYVFAGIESIGLDDKGNIYLLDKKNFRVQVFNNDGQYLDSIMLKKGQGPLEVASIMGMAVTRQGTVYILDGNGNKVIVAEAKDHTRRSFNIGFTAINVVCFSDNRLIIIGFYENHIFHVYDSKGAYIRSFGEPFDVPDRYSRYANFPQLRMPRRADYSPDDRALFVMNDYKPKIAVYKEMELKEIIPCKSEYFKPLEIISHGEGRIGMIFPWVSVLKHENWIYVSIDDLDGNTPNRLEIFENAKPAGSLSINGFAYAIDTKGRIYCSEETDIPRLVRFSVVH